MASEDGVSPREHLERLLQNLERLLVDQRTWFDRIMDERDRRYEQRFEAQEKAVRAALNAAEAATGKFERQEEEWRRNANEWRDAMGDREKEFMARRESLERFDRMNEKVDGLEKRFTRSNAEDEGKSAGIDKTWAIVMTLAPILISVVGVIVALSTR